MRQDRTNHQASSTVIDCTRIRNTYHFNRCLTVAETKLLDQSI